MMLRLNMKNSMGDIQEMLDDTQDIQERITKENQTKNKFAEQAEDIEFELQEIRYKVQELRKSHMIQVQE